jgi:hypothetical protein
MIPPKTPTPKYGSDLFCRLEIRKRNSHKKDVEKNSRIGNADKRVAIEPR